MQSLRTASYERGAKRGGRIWKISLNKNKQGDQTFSLVFICVSTSYVNTKIHHAIFYRNTEKH